MTSGSQSVSGFESLQVDEAEVREADCDTDCDPDPDSDPGRFGRRV